METVTGKIQFLDARETSFGTMYDIKVNGTKYGAGKFKPKGVEQGDYVTFDAEQKGRWWNIKQGTLQKLDQPAGLPNTAAASPARASYGGGDNRQTVISKQAALNTSLSMVKLLQEAGALPLPAKVDKAKAADLIEAMVMEYAATFYQFSTGETLQLPDKGDDIIADLAAMEDKAEWNE